MNIKQLLRYLEISKAETEYDINKHKQDGIKLEDELTRIKLAIHELITRLNDK